MRDNFSNKTKDILAKRVAFKCSFLGCHKTTIASGHENSSDITNLGEAAHIYAASPNGPRYDPNMTFEERASIDNGIWMCRHHARIIDADHINYSAETLKQWKKIAEENSFKALELNLAEKVHIPTTFISLGNDIVFEGVWTSANENIWEFNIKGFILGTIENIKSFNEDVISEYSRFIIIESQGDGRKIEGKLNWKIYNDEYYISVTPKDKASRTTPYEMSDISMDLNFEDGDFKIVKGEECAKQFITIALSTQIGDLKFAPLLGSYISFYYWTFKENVKLLKRLIKLEVIRLISISFYDSVSGKETPQLDFINRILDIEILDINPLNEKLPIKIKLEWGDGKTWEDILNIYINELKLNI